MTKIKVLEIIGDSSLAGAPRHLLGLLENFDYSKIDVSVICPPGSLAGEIRSLKKPVELEVVRMPAKTDLGAMGRIRKHIKKIKPDVIHVHGTRAGVLGRLAAIGLKIPVIYTEHLWTNNYRLKGWFAHHAQLFALWFLDMFTNFNIAVSQAVKDFMVDNQISRSSKITVIYNGIEPQKKKAEIFDKEVVTLGTVGTLNQQKGIQYLIQALSKVTKEFPKIKLIVVGEGPFKQDLEKTVEKNKLKNYVEFTGFAKDVEKEMIDFDVYIQPSLSESFGLAIVQAMSLGIPIIATNSGGIPEVVTAGKTGLLVEAGKSQPLAEAIIELLRDKEKAKKMGKLAAEDARIKFSLKEMVGEVEAFYEKIAKNRS